ncbi:hypothetical protein QIW49_05650 [Francisellaceae bacterium CB300]
MNLANMWRLNYKKNRYMSFISDTELEQRTNDIFSNVCILQPDGKIGLRALDTDDGVYWMRLWTEILEEFVIRFGSIDRFKNGFIKKSNIVNPDLKIKAQNAINKIGGIKAGALYKYSKLKYNNDFFNHGKLRISPASYYNDSSLNYAIKDDELSFVTPINPKKCSIETVKTGNIIKVDNVKIKHEVDNYYVHCFSYNYTFREYDDFNADSCIIIYDTEKLISKVEIELKKKFKNYDLGFKAVTYIDPLNPKDSPDVYFSKHFKYSYQYEYRFVLIPSSNIECLEPFFIEIGSMHEYAELIKLK